MTKRQRDFNKRIQKTITFLETHGWCTGAFAKDSKGEDISPRSKKATNFCVLGAFEAANPTNSLWTELADRNAMLFGGSITHYNDCVATKKQRVIGRLRRLMYT